jgi:hypothetical protein
MPRVPPVTRTTLAGLAQYPTLDMILHSRQRIVPGVQESRSPGVQESRSPRVQESRSP